jgi:hypothetical protein
MEIKGQELLFCTSVAAEYGVARVVAGMPVVQDNWWWIFRRISDAQGINLYFATPPTDKATLLSGYLSTLDSLLLEARNEKVHD